MSTVPDLGSTPEEAMRSAYDMGYSHFEINKPTDWLDPDDFDEPLPEVIDTLGLAHFESIRVAVVESHGNKRLWWALEDFYEEHLPEQYDQFKREAAVAEDYDTAFQAGAYAAIRGDDPDPDEHLSLFLRD